MEQPRVDVAGVQPVGELLGVGDLHPMPGIACLACGTQWLDAAAFAEDTRLQPDEA